MSWQSKSKTRKNARKKGYRSGFESKVADQLIQEKIDAKLIYESKKISYIIPESKRTYTPDFILPNGVIIEAKGRFTTSDRKKMKLIKEQHPELDIRILFQSAKTKLSKASKTTYAQWAEKHGFPWAEKEIPKSWL